MSTTIEPGLIPSATPSLPKSAASTSGVSGTMIKTIPTFSATSFEDPQAIAPCYCSSDTDAGIMSYTQTLWPAFKRCPAMGFPMIPKPMNPMFAMVFSPL
jgi:hypothetical protein